MPVRCTVLLLRSVLVALCLSCALPALAQKRYQVNPGADARFAQGVELFDTGRFDDALAVFTELRKGEPIHQRTTAAYLMSAKAEIALKRYEAVSPLLFEFFQRFPQSGYQSDAYYTLGTTSFVMHNYLDAGRQLVHCLELARDSLLVTKASGLLEYVAEKNLTAENLRDLYASARTPVAKDLLRLKLAEKVYSSGEPSRARIILEDTVGRGYVSPYSARITALRQKIAEYVTVKIGALLPLMRDAESNAVQVLSVELLEGMTFALDEYKKTEGSSSARISLDVRDIGRDSMTAIRVLEDLVKSPETIAVVGPLFSNIAFACAPIAEAAAVPLVSPTATSNGLAATGQFIFQANPDFATRGKAMAQFASAQLGLRRVAVLAPTDGVGKFVAESFLAEARRLGLEVIGIESYSSDVGDLREQCMSLRRSAARYMRQISFAGKISETDVKKMAEAGAPAALLDSLRAKGGTVEARRLFGERGGAIAESLHLTMIVPEIDPENVDTPMTHIQGLFVPVSNAEEIGAIAPQLAFFNFKTQLLGSNEWYDAGQLAEHKRYVNGVMFVSDTYVSAEDPQYAAFDSAYVASTTKHPTKYSLYGYDTMKLLLARIQSGATGRKELAKQLGIVARYPGVHSKITLATKRVNSEVHILQFYNGRVSEIGEVSVP